MLLKVTISELEAAANNLKAAVENYGQATTATKAAADTVSAGWEGDAREAFVAEQENAIQWYRQVAEAETFTSPPSRPLPRSMASWILKASILFPDALWQSSDNHLSSK